MTDTTGFVFSYGTGKLGQTGGALLGSAVPGVGTVIGAGAGDIIGSAGGSIGWDFYIAPQVWPYTRQMVGFWANKCKRRQVLWSI